MTSLNPCKRFISDCKERPFAIRFRRYFEILQNQHAKVLHAGKPSKGTG